MHVTVALGANLSVSRRIRTVQRPTPKPAAAKSRAHCWWLCEEARYMSLHPSHSNSSRKPNHIHLRFLMKKKSCASAVFTTLYYVLRTLFLFMEWAQLRLIACAWRREFVGGFFPQSAMQLASLLI